MSAEPPLVLVVEDERDLADLYATWLRGEYRVRVAYDGREAIEKFDSEVDVALLDRRMPDLSGDETLEAIREKGGDCWVAMVTAVEPDFDIVAMGFDDYLVKPVTREALAGTVENLLLRSTYDEGIQELFSLASKKALLESEKDPATLAANEEYQRLSERVAELRAELDETLANFDDGHDIEAMYRDLGDAFDDESDPG
ncbi:response regulator transcription factor [Halobellus ruber]|uniref:HalX domain-containing protein n=1 Tax=Halobellus ruber TaxID=2761102 RepID=A0A7J9SGQ1_9EURY|nr:HalX domain-containing protein [Halobellus ruber]MBB6646134.1 HalX domain-containing protein [Halobellus ruber]